MLNHQNNAQDNQLIHKSNQRGFDQYTFQINNKNLKANNPNDDNSTISLSSSNSFSSLLLSNNNHPNTYDILKSRCYLKLGLWLMDIIEEKYTNIESNTKDIDQVLNFFTSAVNYNKDNFTAWQQWGVLNFRLAQSYKNKYKTNQKEDDVATSNDDDDKKKEKEKEVVATSNDDNDEIKKKQDNVVLSNNSDLNIHLQLSYVVPAMRGFSRSVLLQRNSNHTIQDLLRLLGLYFDYGQYVEVETAFLEAINILGVDTWLTALPQMIARLDTPCINVRKVLNQLLCKIGKYHSCFNLFFNCS